MRLLLATAATLLILLGTAPAAFAENPKVLRTVRGKGYMFAATEPHVESKS